MKLSPFASTILVVALGGAGVAAVNECAPDLFSFVSSVSAQAQAPKVGALAPAFTSVDTRGLTHSLTGYKGKWVVLEWFNHDCPYTKKHYVGGNTQAMQRDYTKRGVVWLSVVSSASGKEGFTTAAVAERLTAEKGATPNAVIRDTAGTLGHLYGARNTPQYAIIDPAGVLRYAGAIDSKPSSKIEDIADATNYVRAALDAGLAGKPIVVTSTQPYGCTVQY
jgi:peroxiredoxin